MTAVETDRTVAVDRSLVHDACSLLSALERFAREGDGVSISEYLRRYESRLSSERLATVADSVAMGLARSLQGPRR